MKEEINLEQEELNRLVKLDKDLVSQSDFLYLVYEYDKYIRKYPDVLSAYVNRANVLQKLGLYQLALSDIEFVLSQRNDLALAWCHKAFILLLLGNYKDGWKCFEWRFQGYVRDSMAENWPISRWKGEEVRESVLCVLAEQGLGDNIQFVRYVIEAKNRGINVAVKNREPLDRLLYFNLKKHNIPVLGYEPNITNVKYYAHMMSLPYHFQTELDSIPYVDGYINAESDYIIKWGKN